MLPKPFTKLKQGRVFSGTNRNFLEKQNIAAVKHFTEASLLDCMTYIGVMCKTAKIKKILKGD